ncbi:Ig-like domain-containing protein, partial [Bacteroides reticulotermitis]
MKKHIFFVLLAVFAFVSCSEDDASFEDEITLPKKEQANQTAFADDGDTGGGFMFVAKSAWSAAVSETTASRPAKVRGAASSNEVSWLKLSLNGKEAYEGDAGTITLAIVLEPNYSGKTRSAKIVITCGKAKIEVSVTQEGETEKGEVPTDPYPVTGLNLSQSTLSLDLNSTHTLTASVIPSNATIQTVVWSSNNPEVATVDPATGLVTAISAGYATVTAQSTVYETITATCELTVNDPAVPQDKLIKSIA